MFSGDYSFFDYKHNIIGYTGQDFGSSAQLVYLIISLVLLVGALTVLRRLSRDMVSTITMSVSIFLILFYIGKTTWETIYDIKFIGGFNSRLYPLDTCSIIMYAGLISSFFKGKMKEYSDSWLATGCVVGGVATMISLNALKCYPFLSFGALYSMIWHFLMVFVGLLLIVTNYVDVNYKTILKGFIFHFVVSLVVIPIDFIFKFDFMMYRNLGGVPVFEHIATKFTNMNVQFLNPIMMLLIYFLTFNVIILSAMGIKKVVKYLKRG